MPAVLTLRADASQPGEAFAIYQQWSSGGACVA